MNTPNSYQGFEFRELFSSWCQLATPEEMKEILAQPQFEQGLLEMPEARLDWYIGVLLKKQKYELLSEILEAEIFQSKKHTLYFNILDKAVDKQNLGALRYFLENKCFIELQKTVLDPRIIGGALAIFDIPIVRYLIESHHIEKEEVFQRAANRIAMSLRPELEQLLTQKKIKEEQAYLQATISPVPEPDIQRTAPHKI